jgi:hypothetical protein
MWSGFKVICTPVYGSQSFSPTEYFVRVRLDWFSMNLFIYLILVLYVLLIALAWVAQIMGWGQVPGPGKMAFLAAGLVILAAMILGTFVGTFQKIIGNHARMMAQCAELKNLTHRLPAPEQALSKEVKKSRRFRLLLGGLLALLGISAIATGCWHVGAVVFAGQGNDALLPGGLLFLEGSLLFFLTWACWRRPGVRS